MLSCPVRGPTLHAGMTGLLLMRQVCVVGGCARTGSSGAAYLPTPTAYRSA